MRYLVGYGPEQRGIEGLHLAATLASSSGATVDLVVVLPDDAPTFHMYSPDRAYNAEMRKQGGEWLADGLARLPEGLTAQGHLIAAESVAEGLIAEAEGESGSDVAMIVVGASQHVRLGSVAGTLLHSAAVPVAIAALGYDHSGPVTGITCATGLREGDPHPLEFALQMAARWHVPLRLLSLVAVGEDGSPERRQEWTELALMHLASVAERAVAVLPSDCPVTSEVGEGSTTLEALSAVDTAPGEVMVVGSSRLAQPKRLFLGQTARRMMRVLPVPVIVVPRDYQVPAGL